MNLAPLRYRAILERDGGPIESILVARSSMSDGTPCFESVASLSAGLRPPRRTDRVLYEDVDGAGTAPYRSQAVHIAVSEALERWAYFGVREGPLRKRLGFDVEDSTNGMAAFPGWTAAPARANAMLESIERWALGQWWEGRLRANPLDLPPDLGGGIEIDSPLPGTSVVVRWRRCTSSRRMGYGFAARPRLAAAWAKADVELSRNIRALERLPPAAWDALDGQRLARLDRNERRLVFFSTEHGVQTFLERVSKSVGENSRAAPPQVLVDEEVRGPWSRYAQVWRYQLDPGRNSGLLEERADVFRF